MFIYFMWVYSVTGLSLISSKDGILKTFQYPEPPQTMFGEGVQLDIWVIKIISNTECCLEASLPQGSL